MQIKLKIWPRLLRDKLVLKYFYWLLLQNKYLKRFQAKSFLTSYILTLNCFLQQELLHNKHKPINKKVSISELMYYVRFSFPSSKINKPDDIVVMFCGKQFQSDLLLISNYSIHHV